MGHGQRQLARVQDEGLAIGDDDLVAHHPIDGIRHLLFRTAQVDEGSRMGLKHPKLVAQQHIHADATDALLTRHRVDDDQPFGQIFFDITIAKTHSLLLIIERTGFSLAACAGSVL